MTASDHVLLFWLLTFCVRITKGFWETLTKHFRINRHPLSCLLFDKIYYYQEAHLQVSHPDPDLLLKFYQVNSSERSFCSVSSDISAERSLQSALVISHEILADRGHFVSPVLQANVTEYHMDVVMLVHEHG